MPDQSPLHSNTHPGTDASRPNSGVAGRNGELDVGESETRVSRFQILSLDGGGILGLFSAAVLAAIEEDLDTRISDHFDLITGTSTGGIIALGLGMGLRPREIVEFYVNKGPRIFRNALCVRSLAHLVMRKYSDEPLVGALQACFGDRKLGESKKRLVIPAYNLGEDDVYLFRTPHAPKLRRDHKVPLWRIAQATSAAPTYFPACRTIDNLRLIDGGVWANNPVLLGIVEAVGTLDVPMESIRVLSLGTSDPVKRRTKLLDWGGILPWVAGKHVIDVIMRSQSLAAHNQAKHLLPKGHLLRINPRVPDGEFRLDGTERIGDLIGKAAHHSRSSMPAIEALFLGHDAPTFTPSLPCKNGALS